MREREGERVGEGEGEGERKSSMDTPQHEGVHCSTRSRTGASTFAGDMNSLLAFMFFILPSKPHWRLSLVAAFRSCIA